MIESQHNIWDISLNTQSKSITIFWFWQFLNIAIGKSKKNSMVKL